MKRNLWKRIPPVCLLLTGIILGFTAYLINNHKITMIRNANYLADASEQTVKRIDELLCSAENSISAIAKMYEHRRTASETDVQLLEELTEDTPFDYIGTISAEGLFTDNLGRQANVADRDYFLRTAP